MIFSTICVLLARRKFNQLHLLIIDLREKLHCPPGPIACKKLYTVCVSSFPEKKATITMSCFVRVVPITLTLVFPW
jgi:hypothetical protein